MLKKSITLFIICGILACQVEVKKKGDDEKNRTVAPVPIESPVIDGPIEPAFQPTATPVAASKPEMSYKGLNMFVYQAQVAWPPQFENVEIRLNGILVFKQDAKVLGQTYIILEHNKEYHIQFYAVQNALLSADANPVTRKSPFELQQEWLFKTPLDIDLGTQINANGLAQNLRVKAHRIFLGAGKIFQTNGFNLQLEADELFSDSSIVRTFAKEQKAARDQAGRDGGFIGIRALRAIGKLSIAMNGEAGGDGSNGEPYTDRAAAGAQGRDASSSCEWMDGVHTDIKLCLCDRDATSGGGGARGLPARPGKNGRKGGNSGKLLFEIAEPSPQFEVYFENNPGVAGTIGVASPPQRGGEGGQPGSQDSLKKCAYDVGPGPEGPPGDAAPNGEQESNGVKEQECIAIGNGFGRCEN